MKFSIITINYNNCEGLRKTIESVINQTFRDFEYIVIDGGSTDGSVDVINEYADRIDYWVSESDKGIYDAMNKGIIRSKGQWLNFMNSGDRFYSPDVLKTIEKELTDCDILVGRDYHYSEEKQQGFASILPKRISMLTFYLSTLPHQSAFFKHELFTDSLYNTDLRICSDWLFYIRNIVERECSVKLISTIICHRQPKGISNTLQEKVSEERKQVLHSIMPPGIRHDYETLSHLDLYTLYKLFNLCEHPRTARLLTLCIKVLTRLFPCTQLGK